MRAARRHTRRWLLEVAPCKRTPFLSLTSQLGAVKSCTAPVGGCVYGQFNSDSCACACQNEETGESGYCKDASGACTVQKTYNST